MQLKLSHKTPVHRLLGQINFTTDQIMLRKSCPSCRKSVIPGGHWHLFLYGWASCCYCGASFRHERMSTLVTAAVVGCVIGIVGRAVFDIGLLELMFISFAVIVIFQRFVDVLFNDLEIDHDR